MIPTIVVHGGAGNVKPENFARALDGVIEAAKKGYKQLLSQNNESALDAVIAAVVSLEDNPYFNAGYGSSLTDEGTVENDALCMEGENMRVGAVASVKKFKNPIKVARLVMENSDHCILAGEGAHSFGQKNGVEFIDNKELIHQMAIDRLSKLNTISNTTNSPTKIKNSNNSFEWKIQSELCMNRAIEIGDHDTVGAVAIDHRGKLACSVSTGGLTGKTVGRIGDSPLPGSGGWAQNDICAISTTGHGEKIMRINLAKHVAIELEKLHEKSKKEDKSIDDNGLVTEALNTGLTFMKERTNGYGGAICVDKNGRFGAAFTTSMMPWACIDGKKLYYGILPGQIEEKEFIDFNI